MFTKCEYEELINLVNSNLTFPEFYFVLDGAVLQCLSSMLCLTNGTLLGQFVYHGFTIGGKALFSITLRHIVHA